MSKVTKVFNGGEFAACNAAEAWCKENGISVGTTCRDLPRGLKRGDYDIAKWRNLSAADIAVMDGQMTGDMRNGPVTVTMKR